jgi:hypothetical protein
MGCEKPYREVKEFQTDLAATADKPAAVTRGRRFAHVAVLVAFLSVGLCAGLLPAGNLPLFPVFTEISHLKEDAWTMERLDVVAAEDVVAALSGGPFARYLALRQLDDDLGLRDDLSERLEQRRALHDARRRSLSGIGRWYTSLVDVQIARAEAQLRADHFKALSTAEWTRERAREVLARGDPFAGSQYVHLAVVLTLVFLACLAVWVVWAFLWRGGLTLRLLGLMLVRSNGQAAGRWQCAWRALLFWAPVAALTIASLWLDTLYWSEWKPGDPWSWAPWLSSLAWWAGLAMLPAYVVLALRSPERAPHDRLAGTFLVPR